MTSRPIPKPKMILTDIEGTTTSITFVKDVLFPYVRTNLRSYLESTWTNTQTREDIGLLWGQYLADQKAAGQKLPVLTNFTGLEPKAALIDSISSYVFWLMDLDKKVTALKQLQGNIWLDGYKSGKLVAHVYDEVPAKFQEWTSAGIPIAIYSSGSVLAQKLLFGHTSFGDLTKYISHYFDTQVGPKQFVASYYKISDALQLDPSSILFLTDAVDEAWTAIEAGMSAIILTRDGVKPGNLPYRTMNSFNEIVFE